MRPRVWKPFEDYKLHNIIIISELSMVYNIMERTIDLLTQDLGFNPSSTIAELYDLG